MFKNVFKTVKPLFLTSLLVLAVLAILTLEPAIIHTDPSAVSTYYEGGTTVVKGTALSSTNNLDANDEVYYAVGCEISTGPPQTVQPVTNGNFTTDASGWNWTLVLGVDVAGGWENTGQSGGSVYIDVTTRNEKGESYWSQNFYLNQANPESVTLNHQWKCGIYNVVDSCIIKIKIVHPNGTVFDVWAQTVGGTTAWSGTLSISVDTGIFDQAGTYEIRLWDYTDLGNSLSARTKIYYDDIALTLRFPGAATYEVNVEHTSGQVAESITSITEIFLEDNFKFNTTVTAHLEWFNWTANAWANINSGSVGTTEVTWNKTWTSRFSDVINSTGYMKVRIYTSNESTPHRLLEDYLHWDVTYQVPDTTPPTWSNAGTNNTKAGQPTLFHVKWTDNFELSGFIFGTNNTGTWQNDTWTAWSPPGTPKWSNVTKILNSAPGVLVQWRVWANDTWNNWGDTGILSLTTVQPPHAEFTYLPLTPYTGETVTFNATASYDLDGYIVSYAWDFGDNTTSTGNITTHSYADNGVYTVALNVTDNDGLSDTASANVTVLNRSPVANFTESAETVDTGETIYFNATQSSDPDGTIVTYFWDFGDGTNATGVTTSHSYADNGIYTVALTVTDDDGATDTANSTKTVLNRPPVALFTESAESVYVNETISFNASSSYDPDGTIVSYFWNFGDGTNGTGVAIDHSYVDDGTYTVTLTVTDDRGATNSANATKTVLNRSPVAAFVENATTVLTGEVISFNASTSYDPDGSIVSYFWDFGDETNDTGVTVNHSYADDGIYTVTLTVTDDDGATDNVTAIKTVLNRSPVANFTESAETAYVGEPIAFNASSSYDPDGSIASYFWNFGDGTNTTGVVVSHAYASNGTYTVTLTVTDDDGATASANATKTILLNEPPVALFTESAEMVYIGEVISFNASASYDPDGTIVSYFWDFGDGTNTTGITSNHTYIDDGVYTVTLTVTDDKGATDSASATKTVLNRPPIASFTESAETVLTGEVIHFNASGSYDPDGSIVGYFWDFGDGTNTTGMVVDHSYTDDGNYTVTLTVTDDDGATDLANATKTVLNRPPVALFTESADTVYTNEIISFNATASYDPDGYIVSYFWDFGDETNATGVTTSHSYADDGSYKVTLIVTDDDGATNAANATKTVLNRSPVASFTESAKTVYTGEPITFNASASYDLDGIIASYFWDFGDGANATGVTTSHSYTDDGNYTVTLTVTDDDGATASANATKTILNRPPVASFTESVETVYTGETISFNASLSYDPDGTISSYFWDFGDGTNATGATVDHSYVDDGNYTVTLTVTDDDGAFASANATKTVLNRSPVANFTESAETAYVGEPITFNATNSYDPDGIVASYFWDFGDGTNATGVTVDHSYVDDGNYTVTLTVTDDDGATDSANATKTVLNRPPVAIFTESAESVFINETISFDASASYDPDGSIVNYFWDFGDGANATGVTTTHSYTAVGSYTVILTITDDDGATDSANATKIVSENLPPVALFTENATVVLTSETIHFNASSSYDPDGTIVSYFWDFGDGTNATGVTTIHSYADDGTYTVTLTVTDRIGATDSASATKTVLNRFPVALFTENATTVLTGEVIAFNASASYDLDGFVVSYFWTFGDDTSATGVTTTHSYADDGTYTVTLTVIDDDGASKSKSATKYVLNRLPVAVFDENATTVLTGEVIHFDASSSFDPDGSISSYFWDFGDGTNAAGVTVDHSYADDGIYTVALTVTDDDGATDTANSTKTVLNRFPVASFTENATTVLAGEAISFNASSSFDPDGSIAGYFWNFGDGTNATGVTVTHSYADDGTYTVTLTVTDDDGATDTANATKTVLNRFPVALFTENATTVLTGEVIHFDAFSSYDPDGWIVSYFWTFGDGTNATGVAVDHSYADNRTYTVTLTVTDNDGATGSANSTKTVLNRPPLADANGPYSGYEGSPMTFDASGSTDMDGTIVLYEWDWDNDGDYEESTTSPFINHTWTDDYSGTVGLRVTDDDGLTDTATASVTINNVAPIVYAGFNQSANEGDLVFFNGSFTDLGVNDTHMIHWDFGDGGNVVGTLTPTHVYTDNGVYTVTLNITDDDGGVGADTLNVTVNNVAPIVEAGLDQVVYVNQTVYFNGSFTDPGANDTHTIFWDFGDGSNATGALARTHNYATVGNYTVTLSVTDDDGGVGTDTLTVKVFAVAVHDVAILSVTPSTTKVVQGSTINITVVAYNEGTETESFNVTVYHDNTPIQTKNITDLGAGNQTTLMFSWNTTGVSLGNYTVKAIASTVPNETDTVDNTYIDGTVKVVKPPVADASGPYSGDEGFPITLNASNSVDVDGTIVWYEWDCDDDGSYDEVTTSPLINHTWFDDYVGLVVLRVTDDDGLTDTATAQVMVQNIAPTVEAGFNQTVNEGDIVTFSGSYTDPGANDTHTYFWDFGDGTNTTSTLTPTHAYGDNGVYTVTLTVTDDDGGFGVDTLKVTVYNVAPTVNAGPDKTVYLGQTVYFHCSLTDPGTKDTHTIFWDFGDGTNTTGTLTPTHVYAGTGVYIVSLNVTDDDGAFGVDTLNVTVFEAPFYDVAVLNVALSTSEAYWTWTIKINVTVINSGAEIVTFDVKAYFSNSLSWYEIGTQTVTNLLADESTTLAFSWNLAGLTEGANYTVKANATLLYGIDVNPNDNEKVGGKVKVRLWGDVDGNGVVNILDLKKVKLAYSGLIVEPFADLDGNGVVNILDLKKMRLIYSGIL